MAIPNYVLTIHGTDVDYTTGAPFDSVLLSSISVLTGYVTTTVAIIGGAPQWEAETKTLTDVGGGEVAKTDARRIFPVKCYPFTYATGSQDIDAGHGTTTKESAIADIVFVKRHLWIGVEVDNRDYPSATRVYPVNLVEWTEPPNYARGERDIEMKFRHKYIKIS